MKPEHLASRVQVSLASLLGGLALANGGLGAVHGFAGVLGGMIAPHGAICAALLAPVLKMNYPWLVRIRRKNLSGYWGVSARFLLMLSQNVEAKPRMGSRSSKTCPSSECRRAWQIGFERAFPHGREKASKASSMKGNLSCWAQKSLPRY